MVSTITGMLGPLGTPGVRHDRIVSTPERLCPMCKRVQRLSGEERCAIHVKAATLAAHHKEFDTKQISGSSPPGVFVGRFGYPKVFVGPMVPQFQGTLRYWILQNGGWARDSTRLSTSGTACSEATAKPTSLMLTREAD